METLTVKIRDSKVKRLLEDLEGLNLIEIEKKNVPKFSKRRFGSMKGLVVQMAEDFDAPVEEPEDKM